MQDARTKGLRMLLTRSVAQPMACSQGQRYARWLMLRCQTRVSLTCFVGFSSFACLLLHCRILPQPWLLFWCSLILCGTRLWCGLSTEPGLPSSLRKLGLQAQAFLIQLALLLSSLSSGLSASHTSKALPT